MPVHIGEPEVTPLGAEREPLVIEAQAVQDRRLQVVHMHLIAGDVKAQFVGLAVADPPFTPPPASHMV